jgi:hypothetical protein
VQYRSTELLAQEILLNLTHRVSGQALHDMNALGDLVIRNTGFDLRQ